MTKIEHVLLEMGFCCGPCSTRKMRNGFLYFLREKMLMVTIFPSWEPSNPQWDLKIKSERSQDDERGKEDYVYFF